MDAYKRMKMFILFLSLQKQILRLISNHLSL